MFLLAQALKAVALEELRVQVIGIWDLGEEFDKFLARGRRGHTYDVAEVYRQDYCQLPSLVVLWEPASALRKHVDARILGNAILVEVDQEVTEARNVSQTDRPGAVLLILDVFLQALHQGRNKRHLFFQ